MPTDDLPPPPDNPFSGSSNGGGGGATAIAAEDTYRDLLIQEVRQRMRIRHTAIVTALIMLVLLSGYAGVVLWRIAFVDADRILPWLGVSRSAAIALIVSPILSISTIIVMILLGAFRRFKDDDVDKIDARSILSEALKTMPK